MAHSHQLHENKIARAVRIPRGSMLADVGTHYMTRAERARFRPRLRGLTGRLAAVS